ncbi:protein ENHANCED DISEASE RESISTANCE 2-like [Abrus precatorius]|uniref:Protein ENHANCED DISEASE RESISTANCE 2-like n=1 Tax=Abrus precatorius TaxID=3816 RepID=A0A8B8KXL3_ABRPR|nr:protein ENHANCED DISEASE RESISTANCE 2-like [Abrus precatorius]
MAVGVVDGTSEAIFHTFMSLGSSRSEWDFCTYQGSVVDRINAHTDIVHMKLYSDCLPWGMKPRDFLLRRYWKKEDDGTYVMLFHSVYHKKCPPQKGYVRASVKSGGFLVTPIDEGKQSLVKHMLAIDWKLWKLYPRPSSARSLTIRMLERVAALRELFKAKAANYCSEPIEKEIDLVLPHSKKEEDINNEVKEVDSKLGELVLEEEANRETSHCTSLVALSDVDEFFDVPEPKDYDQLENDWHSTLLSELHPQSQLLDEQTAYHPKISSATGLVQKLHDFAVQNKGYMDLQDIDMENSVQCTYGATLRKDLSFTLPCSWSPSDPSLFFIRGETYLKDRQKVKAKGTLMQIVGADWLQFDTRQDDLCSRPGSIVQQYAAKGGPEFFFVVNIQIPGSPSYSIVLYYMMETPLEDNPLLQRFVDGDDAYRNSRFKLIPHISKGPWVVKQSVGKKACLVGQALKIHYFRGRNYLELDIDVGSSAIAKAIVNLVLGYLNNLVTEMAFLIEGNTQAELPELLIGTCRLNHMDVSKAFVVKP